MTEPEKNEKKDDYITNGLIFGMLFGVAIGVATDNLALWIGVGMALGVGASAIFSKTKKD